MIASITIELGELCSLITDGKHGDCRNENGSGYYFVSCKDIKEERIIYENAREITHDDFSETHRRTDLSPGDVLLTNSGTIGRLAIARDDEKTSKTTFQKSVAVLKPKREKITSEFLYYSLKANRNRLLNSAGGAAQKNLLLGDLRRFAIAVPDIDVQRSITSILSTYDNLIENNRRRIQLLEESACLLYQEWFIHLRFPGYEQVKVINGVPGGWEKKTLKKIATLNYGKALKAEVRVPGPFPVYGSSGEVGFHDKALVKGPGIVVGRKGNVGSVYWVNTDFYPIDTVYFVSGEESSLFLYHALQHVQFINTDVAVPGLNRDMAYSREILIPDDKNYQRFLSEVTPIQEQVNKLQDYNNKLVQARDLLLPKLMSGALTV